MADTKNPDMLDILIGQDSWVENGESTTDSAQTVTHAAAANKQHAIHSIIVDYSDAASDRTVVVKFGTTTKFKFNVTDKRIINLPVPLRAATNELIEIDLPAGGTGVTSIGTIAGTTVDV